MYNKLYSIYKDASLIVYLYVYEEMVLDYCFKSFSLLKGQAFLWWLDSFLYLLGLTEK